jgi:glutamine cyclotransferase
MRILLVATAATVTLACVGFLTFSSSCSDKDKVTRPRADNDTIPPNVSVVSPNGGEVLYVGFGGTIRWVATDNLGVDSVSLYYSTDGGNTYPFRIAGREANDSTYAWSIPGTPSVTAGREPAYDALNQSSDASDNAFSIAILDTIPSDTTVTYGFRLINAYPHDRAPHQGLVFERQPLHTRRTGLHDCRVTWKPVIHQSRTLLGLYFGRNRDLGEQALPVDRTSHVGFVYDSASFDSLGPFYYGHEGWGITHDGARFIVSDGTPRLRFWDPLTLAPIDSVDVYQVVDGTRLSVKNLNELEYINGKVYANAWMSDLIAIINPQTGKLEAWIKLTDLVARERAIYPYIDVLNGIAYDDVTGRLFVTGVHLNCWR